mmetsp:Transcript_21145/g.31512  ORF Transcript_21145/g.31512 Transcript_21145/m.31512 type:complete len:335 (+) Transcript_21145:2462-3466(+)
MFLFVAFQWIAVTHNSKALKKNPFERWKWVYVTICIILTIISWTLFTVYIIVGVKEIREIGSLIFACMTCSVAFLVFIYGVKISMLMRSLKRKSSRITSLSMVMSLCLLIQGVIWAYSVYSPVEYLPILTLLFYAADGTSLLNLIGLYCGSVSKLYSKASKSRSKSNSSKGRKKSKSKYSRMRKSRMSRMSSGNANVQTQNIEVKALSKDVISSTKSPKLEIKEIVGVKSPKRESKGNYSKVQLTDTHGGIHASMPSKLELRRSTFQISRFNSLELNARDNAIISLRGATTGFNSPPVIKNTAHSPAPVVHALLHTDSHISVEEKLVKNKIQSI